MMNALTSLVFILFGSFLAQAQFPVHYEDWSQPVERTKTVSVEAFYMDESEITSFEHVPTVPEPELESAYGFMAMAIDQLGLNRNYGLIPSTTYRIHPVLEDSVLFDALIIGQDAPIVDKRLQMRGYVVHQRNILTAQSDLFTPDEAQIMLPYREWRNNVQWDIERLGFNPDNKDDKYEFSYPAISPDGKKAVLKVFHECRGQCGDGQVVAFKWENGQWISTTMFTWQL